MTRDLLHDPQPACTTQPRSNAPLLSISMSAEVTRVWCLICMDAAAVAPDCDQELANMSTSSPQLNDNDEPGKQPQADDSCRST